MSPKKPVIVVAGLGCETSSFSPSRTQAAAFHPKRGHEILKAYPFLCEGTELEDAADWHGALIGHALPGGIVTKPAFEELTLEILQRLQQIKDVTRIDGMWFDIHGAMCVESLDDSEAELLRRIRTVIGPNVTVSASMDLHGNVSRELCHQTDLITVYRTAPHVDVMATKERACRNLVTLLTRRPGGSTPAGTPTLPLKAWVPIPILLPGEQTSTRMEPAKHIYAAVPDVEAMPGVFDVGVWVGYAWADEPRDRAAVVVTGWDQRAVAQGAEKLAQMFWDAHRDFEFVAPNGSLEECLEVALASNARPYFISDSGDNLTAGGSGDVTWTLKRLLARPEFEHSSHTRVIYASIPAGPKAIRIAVEAGIGATITVTVGAEVDNKHAGPITMTGHVHAIKHGDPHAITEVVLRTGSIFVILTQMRKPYHHEKDFTDLDLDPRQARSDIVVVKIGYLEPELYDMAADWMLALTPGGVDQHLVRLGHRRIRRPMWPFDETREKPPDLRARMIPLSSEPLMGPDE
ncbi:hypothetical protein LTR36_003029 [Oleoguttula mirabilis]|uniref:Microcystin LR degradation protein MlrC n=1 Tax=Oleoguttula mirabilis TaxID=1507867 RepID=A0AAV9JWY0_9PEZI|nr:hypothetical protein LTR36_003029 [Oleoguttula mirabilis]